MISTWGETGVPPLKETPILLWDVVLVVFFFKISHDGNPFHIGLQKHPSRQHGLYHSPPHRLTYQSRKTYTHTQIKQQKQNEHIFPLNIGKKKQDLPIIIMKKTWQPHEKGTFIKCIYTVYALLSPDPFHPTSILFQFKLALASFPGLLSPVDWCIGSCNGMCAHRPKHSLESIWES